MASQPTLGTVRAVLLTLLALVSALPGACGRRPPQAGGGSAPLRVVVSVPPLLWAARALAPADAEITLLVPPGASPHGYDLTPSQAAAIAGADLVVLVGMGMEPGVEAVLRSHPRPHRRVVRFEDVVGDPATHDHADHGHADHDHGDDLHAPDPHAWLDPVLMAEFVESLGEAIREPEGDAAASITLANRVADLQGQCSTIDREYRSALSDAPSRRIVVQHNAYSYLARRYGLEVTPIIGDAGGAHGSEPTPGEIARAIAAVRESGVGAVFVERQGNGGGEDAAGVDAAARRVAQAAGVAVLSLDPLGDGDWPTMMRANLASLLRGLAPDASDGGGGGLGG